MIINNKYKLHSKVYIEIDKCAVCHKINSIHINANNIKDRRGNLTIPIIRIDYLLQNMNTFSSSLVNENDLLQLDMKRNKQINK